MRLVRTNTSGRNILAIREMIEWEFAAHVGITCGSTRSIGSGDLGHRKLSARWVPRLLTEDQKANRLAAFERLGTISNGRGWFLEARCHLRWDVGTSWQSRQTRMEYKNLEKRHSWKPRLVFLLRKFLLNFSGIAEAHCSLIFSVIGVQSTAWWSETGPSTKGARHARWRQFLFLACTNVWVPGNVLTRFCWKCFCLLGDECPSDCC